MAKASDLRDNFDAAALDTGRWTQTNNAGSTGSQTGGRYQFVIPASTTGYSNLTSAATYDLTGSSFTVELVDAGTTASGLEAFMRVQSSATNRLFFDVTATFLAIWKTVAGVDTGITFPTYSAVSNRWLRIREAGGTTFWETSPDGAVWTSAYSEANPITVTAVSLVLEAGAFSGQAGSNTILFDNVGTTPLSPPPARRRSIRSLLVR